MAVDHERPFPVAEERLKFIAKELFPSFAFTPALRVKVLKIALLAEQVEQAERTNFFLQEAYEIYNARFR